MYDQIKKYALRIPFRYRGGLHSIKYRYDVITARPCNFDDKLFFIVGCQRSGTTMLGLALDSHPDITIYDEPEAYHRIRANDFIKRGYIGFKIPMWTHRHEYLISRYPNSKFIYLYRNIKSVVSSMLKLQRSHHKWIEQSCIPEIETFLSVIDNKKIRDIFLSEYNTVNTNNDYVSLASLFAYIKNYMRNEYRINNVNYIEINYETLVNNPDNILGDIITFLDVKWDDSLLKHHENKTGIRIGGTDSAREIDTVSVDKWKYQLSSAEIEVIDNQAATLDCKLEDIRSTGPCV